MLVNEFRIALEGVPKNGTMTANGPTLAAALSCQKRTHTREHRSRLENVLGMATDSVQTLEKEKELLDEERIAARRLQHALFKNVFGSCLRHVCDASEM